MPVTPMICAHCDGRVVYCECCDRFIHVEGNTAYCRGLPDGEWLKAAPYAYATVRDTPASRAGGEHRHRCSGKHVVRDGGHYEICGCSALRALQSGGPAGDWQAASLPTLL